MLTLLGATLAGSTRMVARGMIETLRSDYVADGAAQRVPGAARRLALRAAQRARAGVQVFAQNIQYLIGGIIVVEYLFAYPGLGKELVDAVAIRDVREVQSIAILIAAIYILINIVADLLVVLLVPKLRTAECVSGSASRAPGPGTIGLVLLVSSWSRSRSFGPFFAPHPLDAADRHAVRRRRAPRHSLGTDFLGRDVLSRMLWGGRSVLALAGIATLLAYAGGLAIGLVAGLHALARSTRC